MNADDFLPHMQDVSRCADSLRELSQMWHVIESTAKMNCPEKADTLLPMLAATRQDFKRLERDLVQGLVRQKTANVIAEIGTMAQHVIDIIVRNLFERTADVGFLATDRELCEYLAEVRGDRAGAVSRMQAYRDKYTVYDDIVLLSLNGEVMAQVDVSAPIDASTDPLIAKTLDTNGWVETFRTTDLRPGRGAQLVYSQRMLHPATNRPIGLLCLVFGFETEMRSIFASRQPRDGRSLALLLDADNRVIASGDDAWVRPGDLVPVSLSATPELRLFRGAEYLVQTAASAGYQGYPGPAGWQAQVMVPASIAFNRRDGSVLRSLDGAVAAGVLTHAHSYCPPLQEIVQAAETIRRVVWNGQVMTTGTGAAADGSKLETVLEQISETGARSNEVFERSIGDLYDAVLTANCTRAEFAAQLLVELLDRNLYERSDDCRWWALTPEFRSTLAEPAPSAQSLAHMTTILSHINGLYTVYTRLVVYDRAGRIVASSSLTGEAPDVVGESISPDTLQAVLSLSTPQDYHVTPFGPSLLYDDRSTYVYHAAIRQPDNERVVVGGIGIVFDSEAQFSAMLQGGLQSESRADALFVDRAGRVIASADGRHPAGSTIALPADIAALKCGESAARVLVRDGTYAVLTGAASNGYREFKISDGYRDDVLAVIVRPLGAEVAAAPQLASLRSAHRADAAPKFATLTLDAGLFALPAAHVVEALPAADIKAISPGAHAARVGALARRRDGVVHSYVWVFDLDKLLGVAQQDRSSRGTVVVFTYEGSEYGLLVSHVHEVTAFAPSEMRPAPLRTVNGVISQLIHANGGGLLIQAIDPARLHELLLASGGHGAQSQNGWATIQRTLNDADDLVSID